MTDGGLELVLDFNTIALIYLNQITMWTDQRIKDLNSAATVAALPDAPIVVITSSVASDLTQLFSTVLARTVPAFEAAVVPGPSATFPVQGAGPSRSIVVASNEEMISTLSATSNAFCFANGYDITLVRALRSVLLLWCVRCVCGVL